MATGLRVEFIFDQKYRKNSTAKSKSAVFFPTTNTFQGHLKKFISARLIKLRTIHLDQYLSKLSKGF